MEILGKLYKETKINWLGSFTAIAISLAFPLGFEMFKSNMYQLSVFIILLGICTASIINKIEDKNITPENIKKRMIKASTAARVIGIITLVLFIVIAYSKYSYDAIYLSYIGKEYSLGKTDYNWSKVEQYAEMMVDYCDKEDYDAIHRLTEYQGNIGHIKTIVAYNNNIADAIQSGCKNLKSKLAAINQEFSPLITNAVAFAKVLIQSEQLCLSLGIFFCVFVLWYLVLAKKSYVRSRQYMKKLCI